MFDEGTNTELLIGILDKNDLKYSIDNNPSPAKVNRIKRAIERKEALMQIAINAYKQLFRG